MRIRWRYLPGCSCLRGRRTHHADPRGSPCLTAKSFGCVPFTRGKKRPRQNGDLKNGPFESRLLCPQPMRSCCFPPCILPRRSRHFAASVAHAAACTRGALQTAAASRAAASQHCRRYESARFRGVRMSEARAAHLRGGQEVASAMVAVRRAPTCCRRRTVTGEPSDGAGRSFISREGGT